MLCGQGSSNRAVPLHGFGDILDSIITDVLPATQV